MTIDTSAANANLLHKKLIEGEDFTIPKIDWSDPIYNLDDIFKDPNFKAPISVTVEDLTTRKYGGSGVYDALVESTHNQLKEEYDKGRITSNEYAKAYMMLTEAAMGNAVQFLLQKDQSYWASLTAKLNAYTSAVQLEIAKAQLAASLVGIQNEAAKFANTKMGTLNYEANYNTAEFNLANILPAQHVLVKEQGEVQRAQTLDERSDKLVVKGAVGKQKDLYTQQIDSYKRDAEYKVGKFYVDAFTVMKTIDEGLVAPDEFTSANITTVVKEVRSKAGL